MPKNWIGKSSELKLHCFCLFDAYSMPKDMCSEVAELWEKNSKKLMHQKHYVNTKYRSFKSRIKNIFFFEISWQTAEKPEISLFCTGLVYSNIFLPNSM